MVGEAVADAVGEVFVVEVEADGVGREFFGGDAAVAESEPGVDEAESDYEEEPEGWGSD